MSNRVDSYEPPAAMRAAAKVCRDIHMALVREGFSEAQALHIVGVCLSASIQNPQTP